MPGNTIDFTALLAIWMVAVLMLVPLVGFTLRFGVTPLIGAVAELRRSGRSAQDPDLGRQVKALEDRISVLEAERAEQDSAVRFA
jgi:hypothetical protein